MNRVQLPVTNIGSLSEVLDSSNHSDSRWLIIASSNVSVLAFLISLIRK